LSGGQAAVQQLRAPEDCQERKRKSADQGAGEEDHGFLPSHHRARSVENRMPLIRLG
jgi:hypothetical protein